MIKSDLATVVIPAHSSNYSDRRGMQICKFTPHHMAGDLTVEQCGNIFQNPSRNASSNYGIGTDGRIAIYVGEDMRGWTSSNATNDRQAITVEVANCEIGGQWRVSDAAWNSLVNLAVDVCRRYNFRLEYDGTPNGSLTHHNMFAATSCPGPYLQSRMNELAETVNRILDGDKPAPAPAPAPTLAHAIGEVVYINGIYTASNSSTKLNPLRDHGTITKIIEGARNPYLLDSGMGWVNDACIVTKEVELPQAPAKKSTTEIAQEVIAGKWGNGTDRKARLEAAGYNYSEVQAEVNRLCGQPASKPNKKSNEQIANEVIRGEWGNGTERKQRLEAAGYNYNEIQRIVNSKL